MMELGVLSGSEINYDDGVKIISVVENRAREVSTLELYVVLDSHNYTETLSIIHLLEPHEILLHDGAQDKVLTKKIEADIVARSYSRVMFISRHYFNQDRGADMLRKIVCGDLEPNMLEKYTVLGGSYCLLRYIESVTGRLFGNNSVRIEYGTNNNARMDIDGISSSNLELVGGRLLRANLLRPYTDITTLETRYDVVELLLKNNRMFSDMVNILASFPDLDKMLNGLCNVPKSLTLKTARIGIDTLIFVKHTLQCAPRLAAVIECLHDNASGRGANLLSAVLSHLNATSFEKFLCMIEDSITESTTFSKSAQEMRHQECFAVRSGVNGLLDVARTAFLQCVEDIHKLAEHYSTEYSLNVKVAHNTSRGYYVMIPSATENIPEIFVQAVLNKKTISCTTQELMSLSDRAGEAIATALDITNTLIQDMIGAVRDEMSDVFCLVDSVALLDMLGSFADLVAMSPHPFCRPILSTTGPLIIQSGRHPILHALQRTPFVENNTFISDIHNMHIISAPNGAGKSTYIKQVALIVLMAQIGCFVPGRNASIPIRDRILTRIGTNDDMENNMSSFYVEMKETAYIVNHVTEKSLVIIDELGRGTSNVDGLSIAYAVGEYLSTTQAYILFITHYQQLVSMADVYENIKNKHLITELSHEQSHLIYRHQVSNGPSDLRIGYGIRMAEACGLPNAIVASARGHMRKLKLKYPLLMQQPADESNAKPDVWNSTMERLLMMKDASVNDAGKRNYLAHLRSQISDAEVVSMIRFINETRANLQVNENDNKLNNIAEKLPSSSPRCKRMLFSESVGELSLDLTPPSNAATKLPRIGSNNDDDGGLFLESIAEELAIKSID